MFPQFFFLNIEQEPKLERAQKGLVYIVVNLICVIVAPVHSKLERSTLVVFPDWPVVLQRFHASYVEIMEARPNIQGH